MTAESGAIYTQSQFADTEREAPLGKAVSVELCDEHHYVLFA